MKNYEKQRQDILLNSCFPYLCSLECLSERENRVGIDQVKDAVERSIKKEVDNVKKYQTRFHL